MGWPPRRLVPLLFNGFAGANHSGSDRHLGIIFQVLGGQRPVGGATGLARRMIEFPSGHPVVVLSEA